VYSWHLSFAFHQRILLFIHPSAIWFINPEYEYVKIKIYWMLEQFMNGLKIKLQYV